MYGGFHTTVAYLPIKIRLKCTDLTHTRTVQTSALVFSQLRVIVDARRKVVASHLTTQCLVFSINFEPPIESPLFLFLQLPSLKLMH